MNSLIFLTKKRDGRIKARTCADGSTQRAYISKEDATSPTVMTESILLTATIEAQRWIQSSQSDSLRLLCLYRLSVCFRPRMFWP